MVCLYVRLSEITILDRPRQRIAVTDNCLTVDRPAGHILTCRRLCGKGERFAAACGYAVLVIYGDIIAGGDIVLDLLEPRFNVNRACAGCIRIDVGFRIACTVITHMVDVPAFDFVAWLYLCRELNRNTCRNIGTSSRVTDNRRFIRFCRADVAAYAVLVRRTKGNTGHLLDKTNPNLRFSLQIAQRLARCGIRRSRTVDCPVLYAVAVRRCCRDRDIRVAVEAVRAGLEVILLICAHTLAGDLCGNRAAVTFRAKRINGQGEVVFRNLGRRNNDGLICGNRTGQLVKLLLFRLLLNPACNRIAVHRPCGQLVAEMRRREEFQHRRVHEYKAAAVQRAVLCGNVRICAGEHNNRFLTELSRHRSVRCDILYSLRACAGLVGILRSIIEFLTTNRDALNVVAFLRLRRDGNLAVMIDMLVGAVLCERYLVHARTLDCNCAVFGGIYRHLRLLRDVRDNLSVIFQTCNDCFRRIVFIRLCIGPAGNIVVFVYIGRKLNRRIIADYAAAGNVLAILDFCGNRSNAFVDRIVILIHSLEFQRYILCRIDYSCNHMRCSDIAQCKLLLRTRTGDFLIIHLPRLDRVVIAQIFQCKRYGCAVRHGIQICRCAVCQLRRGLHGRQCTAGLRLSVEGNLISACLAKLYLYLVVVLHVFQRQRGLTVQIGRTRPVIRLVVHPPACYRHTAVRLGRERHSCAFRNLLSGRDCTAVL